MFRPQRAVFPSWSTRRSLDGSRPGRTTLRSRGVVVLCALALLAVLGPSTRSWRSGGDTDAGGLQSVSAAATTPERSLPESSPGAAVSVGSVPNLAGLPAGPPDTCWSVTDLVASGLRGPAVEGPTGVAAPPAAPGSASPSTGPVPPDVPDDVARALAVVRAATYGRGVPAGTHDAPALAAWADDLTADAAVRRAFEVVGAYVERACTGPSG